MKFSNRVFLAVGLAVAVAAGLWVAKAKATDTDSDGRDQMATWVVNPAGPPYLAAKATTTNPLDRKMAVELWNSSNVMVGDFWVTFTSPPSPTDQGEVQMEDQLVAYPSGSGFTVVGKYYDANNALIDTEAVPFIKP